MKESDRAVSPARPADLRSRLIGLWLVSSLVWCGFIATLAFSEWRAYQRALHGLDLAQGMKAELPDPPPAGFYMLEKSLTVTDNVEHSETMLWFFGVIAIIPPGALLLLGLWGRRVGAL